ncbi:6-phosphogluconolactonase (cycloisomerase 2 family) [Arthrobacter pigmenti]|uniref:6-phosphogluconolactonase (Cycloisomerase 2 family) n=1 Tax=Arthrobacter pigmenti TaxID=271432 RepID=A0A846RN39_9MICC|nr:beta-propeller fold lactonase family protein [Arthrobacter pigmenti]NJC21235.1 6-phosphogluconolactonase (cycloisomerase 2 family) [Arthrobacter pigmenti]
METAKLWIGTYPANGTDPGSGEGIWQVTLDRRTGKLSVARLAITTPSPSFLALHPSSPVLYAVSETAQGEVSAFAHDDGGLTHLRTVPTGGSSPCHIYAQQHTLWVANYGDGVVTQISLDDGVPTGEFQAHEHSGSGVNKDRQEGPHAHFVHEAGAGQRELWVSDLGTDELRRFTSSGADGIAAVLPPGTGPRHAVALPGRAGGAGEGGGVSSAAVVVVGELDARLHVISVPDGAVLSSQPALTTQASEDKPSQPSHIGVGVSSATAHLLYAATRGPDVLSVFAVGEGASLTHLAESPIGGQWPRHFAVVAAADDAADLVIVANQYSSTLDVLRCDPSGRAVQVESLGLPVPACVLPA